MIDFGVGEVKRRGNASVGKKLVRGGGRLRSSETEQKSSHLKFYLL